MNQSCRSFRIVSRPEYIGHVESLLEAEGFVFEPEPFSCWCRKLLCEPFPLGSSLAAFFGYIYIQDRSSMLPPLALAPEPGACVLDMAASPGSKTGFLAQLTGEGGFVLGNEPNPGRLENLRANLFRANLIQAATCSYSGEKLPLSRKWPYILLDPPCSGWGTVAKNPNAIKIWQGSKIDRLIALQRSLLKRASVLLEPAGKLLYSTCTTNRKENEEQTHYAREELGLQPIPIFPFPGFEYSDTAYGSLQINGDACSSQGFYLSLLTKESSGSLDEDRENISRRNVQAGEVISRQELASPVCDPEFLPEGIVCTFNDKVRFLPQASEYLPEDFRWQGALLGKWQSERFNPAPRLRILLPSYDKQKDIPVLILEKTEEARELISGRTLASNIPSPMLGLWWRDLPLGICRIKNGRVIANFR